jgi:hypothetical protein
MICPKSASESTSTGGIYTLTDLMLVCMFSYMSEHTILQERSQQEKEALFAALDAFVNCGIPAAQRADEHRPDNLRDLQLFRLQNPQFFPQDFYDQSEMLARAGKDNYFDWYKRLLRAVWEGRDAENKRLAVLLGLENAGYYGPLGGDFQREAGENMAIFSSLASLWSNTEAGVDLAAHQLFSAHIAPDWQGEELRYRPAIEFQEAVYALMRESWRARLCNCGRYIIAAKPKTTYCSTGCNGKARAKQERDRVRWHSDGKAQRAERKRKKKEAGQK